MRALVTGSAGHLGEALVRTLRQQENQQVSGLDVLASAYTDVVGSITDRALLAGLMVGVDVVFHAATLHKPHVATHTMQDFLDVNLSGTLALLEAAADADVKAFVFTSTTSTFGNAMQPQSDESVELESAVWVSEDLVPIPKNIYGVTKIAAEDLCRLFYQRRKLACLVLRTSRFFLEQDDDARVRARYPDENAKVNELLFRRADIADIVQAHLLAAERAAEIGFGKYIISATTPFRRADAAELCCDAPAVVARYVPEYQAIYQQLGWQMFPDIGRVYDNERARHALGWQPQYDFRYALQRLAAGDEPLSELAREVGIKPYHNQVFSDGPYPVE